jgi:hypothetical protein
LRHFVGSFDRIVKRLAVRSESADISPIACKACGFVTSLAKSCDASWLGITVDSGKYH